MNEELLKHMLNLKFSLARKVIEGLPGSLQKPVKDLETQIIRALHDVSKEYVENTSNSENTKAGGLKPIDVD